MPHAFLFGKKAGPPQRCRPQCRALSLPCSAGSMSLQIHAAVRRRRYRRKCADPAPPLGSTLIAVVVYISRRFRITIDPHRQGRALMNEHHATATATATATAIAHLATLTILAGCQAAQTRPLPAVPERLAVPAGQTLSQMLKASGGQIYECKPSHDDPMRMEWALRAPEAELRDPAGELVGRHYAGPTWEAHDGSKVVGEVSARYDSPDPNAIPWLLLKAASTTGRGVFSQTTSVQRLNTSGGKAPTSGCDQTQNGKEARVSYTAEYFFYHSKP